MHKNENHPSASHGIMGGFTIRGLLCFLSLNHDLFTIPYVNTLLGRSLQLLTLEIVVSIFR